MAYHTTANGEIYVEQNGIDVLLFPDTAAAILNDKTARIAALESALCEIAKLSDAERGGDIYIKMQKVNKHATAALGK